MARCTSMTAPLVVGALVACSHPAAPANHPAAPPPPATAGAAPAPRAVTLSIVGTNDLHGALERLPMFGGYVANLRAARAADGGGVVLLDGGDMFQGTLESNLAEGADVVKAYNQLGYTAVAIGNHEFDYGPEGPAATAHGPDEDPRGALKARVRDARFPFLTTNLFDDATGARVDWPNTTASLLVEVAGVKVGIVGSSTESTPRTTMPANFAGLRIAPPAAAIAEQAAALRARGAQVVVAAMHIGTACKSFDRPDDDSSCDKAEEIYGVIRDLPHGAVDVIVAGHTHAGVAHRIAGVAVIEGYASGRAFGRVDVRIGPDGAVAGIDIFKPQALCQQDTGGNPLPIADCKSFDYAGKAVTPDPEVQRVTDAAIARGRERRAEALGVTLGDTVHRAWATESAEGNLLCDLMLEAHPDAQVSMTNGGGLRADLPAGRLTYGDLFTAVPFDNRFALLDVTGQDLRSLVESNLEKGGGILSWGGLTARARCKAGKLAVQIQVRGKPLDNRAHYKLATSDFLASGGDGVIGRLNLPASAIKVTDAIIRDALADVLRARKATPRAAIDPAQLYSAARPRLDYEGKRPVECEPHAKDAAKETAQ